VGIFSCSSLTATLHSALCMCHVQVDRLCMRRQTQHVSAHLCSSFIIECHTAPCSVPLSCCADGQTCARNACLHIRALLFSHYHTRSCCVSLACCPDGQARARDARWSVCLHIRGLLFSLSAALHPALCLCYVQCADGQARARDARCSRPRADG
jgi:hypothetical protein